ncbi:hypothetical protein ACOZB2_27465 [Pantoea endophytica]
MNYLIKGWIIAATIYTCLDVSKKLCQIYPDQQLAICIIGVSINIVINLMLLSYPTRGRE